MENNKKTVLALKYRPKNFKELIGQDIMVQTITNSIMNYKSTESRKGCKLNGLSKSKTMNFSNLPERRHPKYAQNQ